MREVNLKQVCKICQHYPRHFFTRALKFDTKRMRVVGCALKYIYKYRL